MYLKYKCKINTNKIDIKTWSKILQDWRPSFVEKSHILF